MIIYLTTIRGWGILTSRGQEMNLIDVAKQFATPQACNDFLEEMRWPDGVGYLKCGSKRVSKYVKQAGVRKSGAPKGQPLPARILRVCLECGKQFSVSEGTIFNDTHLPIEKWFHGSL